jgi:hypothetical protein
VHHRDERRGFAKTTVGTPFFLPPPVTRPRSPGPSIAVVCAEKLVFGSGHSFAFGRPITITPAPPFFRVCYFPNTDSFLYAIVVLSCVWFATVGRSRVCVTACSVNASLFRYCWPRGHFCGLASLRPVYRVGWLVDSGIVPSPCTYFTNSILCVLDSSSSSAFHVR